MSLLSNMLDFGGSLSSILKSTEDGVQKVTNKVENSIKRLKKKVILSLLQACFVLLSVAFVITGTILLLSRYFSLDLIFLAIGVIFLYISLLLKTL